MEDKYNLKRFIEAQNKYYDIALLEIKNGQKKTHWMWYIFPQLIDLGYSTTSKYYGIKNIEEAQSYLENQYLRNNLIEISKELYKQNTDILDILGYPDNLKLKSSMTLFSQANPEIIVFKEILNKFYDGEKDQKTLELLKK